MSGSINPNMVGSIKTVSDNPNGSLVKFGQMTERFTPAETVQQAPSG